MKTLVLDHQSAAELLANRKVAYTCEVCNEHWSAASPNFAESHLSSDSHRNNQIKQERAELLDALKKATRELEWLDRNALIKSRAGGDYIEVEHLPEFRALIASIEGV
jgi:hypothetical protein